MAHFSDQVCHFVILIALAVQIIITEAGKLSKLVNETATEIIQIDGEKSALESRKTDARGDSYSYYYVGRW